MMAGSHVVVGAAAWVLAAPHLGLHPLAPEPLALAVAGAVLPDIDHPKSWLGRRVPILSRPLAALVGHRGFTHSLLAVALCLFVLHARGWQRGVVDPLVVGYLSHLAADLVTPAGLRLAWPLAARQSFPLCRTGGFAEPLIVALLLGFVVARIAGAQ
jgi:inner membrane protein